MKENYIKLSHNLIFGLIVLSAIISPLFFLPTTSEFFDFNKFTAFLAITVAGLLIWASRMIIEKKFVLTRTPLDLPILAFVAVSFVASLTSVDQFISAFGNPARIWPSFFPLATLVAFYFLTVSNLKTKKQVTVIVWALALSTTFAAVLATVSYFGAYLPFEFARFRAFNTLGSAARLAVLEVFILPATASIAIFSKDKFERLAATVITLILAFSFILINLIPAYIALFAAAALIGITSLRFKLTKTQKSQAAALAVFITLFLVIRFVPQVARGTLNQWISQKEPGQTESQQIDTPKEKFLPTRSAWDISAKAIGKRPLFGTGPGTFAFAFTQLKPRELNSTDNWAQRYDRGSSDFAETITTTGIFGTLAFLLLIVSIFRFAWTLVTKSEQPTGYLATAAALVAYLVSTLVTVSSFATASVFFLGLALLATLAKAANDAHVFEITVEISTLKNRLSWFQLGPPNSSPVKIEPADKGPKSQVLPAVASVLVLLAAAFALNYQIRAYRGEYFFRQYLLSQRSTDGNRIIGFLEKAIRANPKVDTYHRTLSQNALAAAVFLSRQKDLTDQQKETFSKLIQASIDQGKIASGYTILPLRLPGISAFNVANWEQIATVYRSVIGLVGDSSVHAQNTLAYAVSLDPENPILHDQLGSLYEQLNNSDLAQRKFEDAIIVKADFGPAHYHLAKILIDKKGEVTRIVNELLLAKRTLPKDDLALPDIEKNLENYNKELNDLQQKAAEKAKETQNQASPSPESSPKPSPTPSATPQATPSPSPSL